MFNLFKKQTKAKPEKENNNQCSGDESCPMCQVSDEVMEAFGEKNKALKGTDPKQNRNKRVRP